MTIHEAYTRLKNELYFLYDHAESVSIAGIVMEKLTGLSKSERHINGLQLLTPEKEAEFMNYAEQLGRGKPVQQIFHEAWFHNLPFYVNENVLIPRPETDELVQWAVEEIGKEKTKGQKLLDIGTGSGCIPISLKKELPELTVHALDVSEEALKVAKQNASTFKTEVAFYQIDILDKQQWDQLPVYDYIISNPPYIKLSESQAMHKNVLSYEPHLALFVEDDDALLFYRTIVEFAQTHLRNEGSLFFEINEALADDVMKLLDENKFDRIELASDMQGKDRMIKATFL
jgi:release factor glutamine methyltransferase